MRSTTRLCALGAAGLAAAVALVATAATGANGRSPLGPTPEAEAPVLACGASPLMVVHADLYIPSRADDPARSPREAVLRLAAEHYPRLSPTAAREVANDLGRAKFHVRDAGGGLLASFLVSSHADEYYVEQLALCESTAKRWAR